MEAGVNFERSKADEIERVQWPLMLAFRPIVACMHQSYRSEREELYTLYPWTIVEVTLMMVIMANKYTRPTPSAS